MPLLPLIGHQALRARLEEQIARGTLPSSLLFHGPPGVGKQRLALWLGQRLLCTGATPPCGECEHCRYTLQGAHPDLRWFFPRPRLKDSADVALDDVAREYAEAIAERVAAHGLYARSDGSEGIFVYVSRLIVSEAGRTPAIARAKVFIVGDAERMVPQTSSQEAANAFLKLLEEPLPDTRIILTSSEPGALLPTIRSRVVAIRVAPLLDADVRAFLQQPAAATAAGASDKSATVEELVRLAHGAPGALLDAPDRGAALQRARSLLDAAGRGRDAALRAVFVQGSSKARGAFTDVLDAVTVLLHERARRGAHGRRRRRVGGRAYGAARRRGQACCRGERNSAARHRAAAASRIEVVAAKRTKTTSRRKPTLSHVSGSGNARMVDVSGKASTARRAVAEGRIRMSAAAMGAVRHNAISKGDVLAVARLAGITAAKRTAELIPLCHPLALTDVHVELTLDAKLPGVRAVATVSTVAQTGVEMEALTAVSVALLTVYDMVKSADKAMRIERVRLLEKTGGASGAYRARR